MNLFGSQAPFGVEIVRSLRSHRRTCCGAAMQKPVHIMNVAGRDFTRPACRRRGLLRVIKVLFFALVLGS
jgi:hypothetical protein